MIFRFFGLLDDLTVADDVLPAAQPAGIRRVRGRARADDPLAGWFGNVGLGFRPGPSRGQE